MIYDSADIALLRFAAAAKNIPPDLQYRLSSRVWDREHIHTLCAQKLLAENRNHLSISLTLKGAALLNHLGWPVTLDAKQPARNKLERRLQSAWIAALFYRAGFDVFNNKVSDLALSETYLPANALRRDTTAAATRVFAGVRYMGIAHSTERMLLAHYVDGGHMYITSEMRMFNTMAMAVSNACIPVVVYCGLCYDDLARLLTGASAFTPAKRRGSDAVTYKDQYGVLNIRSVMRQLAYMGKVQAQENLWCALWRKPVPALIDAFDVMMLMCDDTVPQFRVEHDQCQLTFYLPGEAGELPNSFKVYYVIGGQEMDACETACTRRDPLGHMVLYIVSSLAQIERLYCNKPFFAALKGGDGRFEFFQGNIQ